jgi:mannose-6-phosphate isomerase-like protein (cupin superfamily)
MENQRYAFDVVEATDKFWGETRKVYQDQHCEVHHATPRAGGYSSRHVHEAKVNVFYVVSGRVTVTVYSDGKEAKFTLCRGHRFEVAPNIHHRFSADEDSELMEVYYLPTIRQFDIVRFDEGGQLTA